MHRLANLERQDSCCMKYWDVHKTHSSPASQTLSQPSVLHTYTVVFWISLFIRPSVDTTVTHVYFRNKHSWRLQCGIRQQHLPAAAASGGWKRHMTGISASCFLQCVDIRQQHLPAAASGGWRQHITGVSASCFLPMHDIWLGDSKDKRPIKIFITYPQKAIFWNHGRKNTRGNRLT